MTARASSAFALHLKQAGAFRGGLIALGVVVLIATIAVTAWPRAVASLLTGDLQHRVAAAAPGLRDVQAVISTHKASGSNRTAELAPAVTGVVKSQLEARHKTMPQPLKSVLTQGGAATRSDPLATSGPVFNYHYNVQLEGYVGLEEASTLKAGRWPRPNASRDVSAPLEVVLSASTAHRMGWVLGAVRHVSLGVPATATALTLVGIVSPHSNTDFWLLDPLRANPALENLGDRGFKLTAVAWVNPAQWQKLQYSVDATTTGWYGVSSAALNASNVAVVQRQLSRFIASPPPTDAGAQLRFTTSLDEVLSAYVAGAGPAQTLLLLLAAGPLGVALAVLLLGIELLVDRRRRVLALLSARGASEWRIRGSLAVEALTVSLPAAAVAVVITLLLVPGRLDLATLVLAVCCVVAPPVAMAAVGSARTRAERSAARSRGFTRWRWVVECSVIAAAVLATFTLFQRGLAPVAGSAAADPLLVVTPLLICVAVAVVVMRAVPLLLKVIAAMLRRRTGVIGFLGAARAQRTSTAMLLPMCAVLIGLAVTVFSTVVFATENSGIEQAARGSVGADVSVTDAIITPAQLDRMRHTPGVAGLVPVSSAGYAMLTAAGSSQAVIVMLANTDALAQLQSDLPHALRTPPGMSSSPGGRIPMLLGGWSTRAAPHDGTLAFDDGTLPVRVASPTAVPGSFVPNQSWVLLDAHAVPTEIRESPTSVTTALIRLHGRADRSAVAARLAKIAGASATVENAAVQAAQARSAPIVGGLGRMLLIAIGLAAALGAVALVLTLALNTASRTRLTATLRPMGFSARQSAGLMAWEITPIIISALIGGVAAGLALPLIVLTPLDLAAFTGGTAHPVIVVDGALMALAVGGFFLICAAAAAVLAVMNARRGASAGILRTGEDE
jgi:putative ABC transport system permease protein